MTKWGASRMHALRRQMLSVEPLLLELILIVASLWAFWVLARSAPIPGVVSTKVLWAMQVHQDEHLWRWMALASACCQASGFVLSIAGRKPRYAVALRIAGLWLAALIWLVMAISLLVGENRLLFPIWGLIAGFWALWLMVRWPAEFSQ